ncbi:L-2-hydroxyglutarate oxidase [Desulfuromusa kysingii]|uniref:L-2-hydroxyglutarate oxidase n=1 Tax=Desulfuromusa kysingii TaxID=37625 RepID=A0A1H3VZU3_9BACT|nr:L-2-hydroxyglutarate oxidase [Desulfuromusa kysingii]SDZ79724.1 L-2-hydroxyglutarate oxidase [Desulfuromusa kysingii]
MKAYDFIVIGGGIIGLATARQLQQQYHGAKIVVLEKEKELASHQTRHNSGVIHAGVYYAPGSLKARFCREGNLDTKQFCREHDIPFRETGKLLVATDEQDAVRMQDLLERCRKNEIKTEVFDQQQLHEFEPNVVGVAATWVASSGIVDYEQVAQKLAEQIRSAGGEIYPNCRVTGLSESADMVVKTTLGTFSGRFLVSCAGLYSDRIIQMLGQQPTFKILPFRGEYFQLPKEKSQIVTHPIYPIPNPDLPFLGIHLTPMIDGTLTVGPNATLALAREGYSRWKIDLHDLIEMLSYSGLYRLVMKYPLPTLMELKNSLYRPGYLKLVNRYCPQVTLSDLRPYPAGVRAQAVKADGTTLDDFLFVESERSLIVGNAPSPAATSAMPIARHICDKVSKLIA